VGVCIFLKVQKTFFVNYARVGGQRGV